VSSSTAPPRANCESSALKPSAACWRICAQRIAANGDPRRLGQPLTGDRRGFWRYRVGDYRIVAAIEDDRFVVLVVTVGHRREVYR
jgi:mRNA interferase RelE/StbE